MEDLSTRLRTVEIAREALAEANERMKAERDKRETAINALIDYALAAYVGGDSIESIMDATDVIPKEGGMQQHPVLEALGLQAMAPQENPPRTVQFAQWMGQCFAERIIERAQDEGSLDG